MRTRAEWLGAQALEILDQTSGITPAMRAEMERLAAEEQAAHPDQKIAGLPIPPEMAATSYDPEADRKRTAKRRRLLAGLLSEQRNLTAQEWKRVALIDGRNGYPQLLWAAYSAGALAPGAIAELAPDAWSMPEYPQEWLTARQWRALFDAAGFTVDGEPAERPTTPVRVWRGAYPWKRRWWSWTTSCERAERFANRLPPPGGQVWATLAPPGALFAMIGESHRGEAEVVLDSRGLKIVPAEENDELRR